MSREEIRTYRFKCNQMRYTSSEKNMLELCGEDENFTGVDVFEAARKARQEGWKADQFKSEDDCCPFYLHSITPTEDWPEYPNGVRSFFEIPRTKR